VKKKKEAAPTDGKKKNTHAKLLPCQEFCLKKKFPCEQESGGGEFAIATSERQRGVTLENSLVSAEKDPKVGFESKKKEGEFAPRKNVDLRTGEHETKR